MLNRAQLDSLAEDLHIAIATGEYTRDGAIALLVAMGDGIDLASAKRILRKTDPMEQGNSYTLLPNGQYRPQWGTARVAWEYTDGNLKGVAYLPTLIERYGADAAIRTLAAQQ